MSESMVLLENGEVWALNTLAEVGIDPADTVPVEFVGAMTVTEAEDIQVEHPLYITDDEGFPVRPSTVWDAHSRRLHIWRKEA